MTFKLHIFWCAQNKFMPLTLHCSCCRGTATALCSATATGYNAICSPQHQQHDLIATLWHYCCSDSITDVVCAINSLIVPWRYPWMYGARNILHTVWVIRLDASNRMTTLQSVVTFILQATGWEPVRRVDTFVLSWLCDITVLMTSVFVTSLPVADASLCT